MGIYLPRKKTGLLSSKDISFELKRHVFCFQKIYVFFAGVTSKRKGAAL